MCLSGMFARAPRRSRSLKSGGRLFRPTEKKNGISEFCSGEIFPAIQEPKEPLLERVELFDLFTTNVGEARKSLAYRLTYRDRSRTLTSEEVSAVHAKIRERLQRDLGAELRE